MMKSSEPTILGDQNSPGSMGVRELGGVGGTEKAGFRCCYSVKADLTKSASDAAVDMLIELKR